jgi:hypothetical protein
MQVPVWFPRTLDTPLCTSEEGAEVGRAFLEVYLCYVSVVLPHAVRPGIYIASDAT